MKSTQNPFLASRPQMVLNRTRPMTHGLINEVNVKHGYQIGAECIDWFVGKFISGETHDPVRAFNESRDQFAAGNYPILSLSNDAVFSEAHAVFLLIFGIIPIRTYG